MSVGRRDAGVSVDPTAIDWLRLAAAGGCVAGSRVEVPYEADYVFWRA